MRQIIIDHKSFFVSEDTLKQYPKICNGSDKNPIYLNIDIDSFQCILSHIRYPHIIITINDDYLCKKVLYDANIMGINNLCSMLSPVKKNNNGSFIQEYINNATPKKENKETSDIFDAEHIFENKETRDLINAISTNPRFTINIENQMCSDESRLMETISSSVSSEEEITNTYNNNDNNNDYDNNDNDEDDEDDKKTILDMLDKMNDVEDKTSSFEIPHNTHKIKELFNVSPTSSFETPHKIKEMLKKIESSSQNNNTTSYINGVSSTSSDCPPNILKKRNPHSIYKQMDKLNR